MKNKIILASLLALTLFVSLGSICASEIMDDVNSPIIDDNNDFTMSARYNTGTGYYWQVSPESYGVELISTNYEVDHPDTCGSSATAFFNFHINSDDYYVKLILISPTGEIVNELDSNMIN